VNVLSSQVLRFGIPFVAGHVFMVQFGFPVPVMPVLIVSGALVADGQLPGPLLLASVVVAAVAADSLWYFLGRKYGWHLLRLLGSLSLSADTFVQKTSEAYDRVGLKTLLFAKFVPGLSAVAVPISGALKAPYGPFVAHDAAGTLIWAGAGIGLGAIFHPQVDYLLRLLQRLGAGAFVLLASALAVYLSLQFVRRRKTLARLRMARLSPGTLAERLLAGDDSIVVADVRNRIARRDEPRKIPGAIVADLGELDAKLREIPFEKEVALYCT
jgi:membrane protein DedA with SNARE-associated domain